MGGTVALRTMYVGAFAFWVNVLAFVHAAVTGAGFFPGWYLLPVAFMALEFDRYDYEPGGA